MKVTVIGYWGAFPKKNEATSCYLFEHDGFRLLVDCGSGALAQL
ncbi:MAG: MBL fold metallo-hydrolase, partial [Anoxybacillus gonensis]|nr:MBL fold metallo-hydrolase [Anoxybacillus gonensis]